ncbi:MAG: hypothetical protein WA957_01245 [Alteraurantiacibacter sp.]
MTIGPVLLDRHLAVRAAAILLALAALGWALAKNPSTAPSAQVSPQVEQLLPVAQARAISSPLFPAGDPLMASPAELNSVSPPELLGLAGRLPDDVEVLARDADGETVTLRIGQSAQGWTLMSVAADRAVFEKNGEQAVRTLD